MHFLWSSWKNKHTQVDDEVKELLEDDDMEQMLSEAEEAWLKSYNDLAFFPNRQAFGRVSGASKADRLAAIIFQFDALASNMEKDAKKVIQEKDGEKMRCLVSSDQCQCCVCTYIYYRQANWSRN